MGHLTALWIYIKCKFVSVWNWARAKCVWAYHERWDTGNPLICFLGKRALKTFFFAFGLQNASATSVLLYDNDRVDYSFQLWQRFSCNFILSDSRNKNALNIPLCKSTASLGQRSLVYRASNLWIHYQEVSGFHGLRAFKTSYKEFLTKERFTL